ncbi:Dioxygenase subfamily protein [Calothrix sp. PCC 7716]|nr:Dioxygenase subfamily protein [Calothrix sp. PCC 7716]
MKNPLTRRQTLSLLRAAGTAILVIGCTSRKSSSAQAQYSSKAKLTSLACVVSPQQTEGPYFVDDKLNRSDIRTDPTDGTVKEGVPLQLTLKISQVSSNGCVPLENAIVDIWHCDALGVYSDVQDRSFNTVGKKFLRGYQTTDANGTVNFTTIYPGWYPGRTTHIHVKVRTQATSGQGYEFISQLYFDDSISNQVYTLAPYASKGQHTANNAQDGIFNDGGAQMLLKLTPAENGYGATLDIGVQMT